MILHLSGELDYKMFDALVKAINESKEEILDIYFTCPEGGIADVTQAIVDVINKYKTRINMIFYGENFSAGMYVLLKTECSKKLLPDTRGMYHFSWQIMSITEGGLPSGEYDIFSMKEMKKAKQRSIEFLQTTKFNEKEINLIKRGRDLYISHERLLELI